MILARVSLTGLKEVDICWSDVGDTAWLRAILLLFKTWPHRRSRQLLPLLYKQIRRIKGSDGTFGEQMIRGLSTSR